MLTFFRSIRVRMAVTYSLVVFGLAFLVIAGVNLALSRTLDDEQVAQRTEFRTFVAADGSLILIEDRYRTAMADLETLVNQRAQDNLRRFSLWALVGMFPASIVLGWLIADRALRPIGRITDVAKDIQASDLSRRIELDGPEDELRALADTFDDMLDRVEGGVEAQRKFIEDASHELRNPLAVIRTNLDVALADETADAASLRSAAEVVRRTIDRTSRTVDELIVFARREVPDGVRSEFDLATLVEELVEEYAPSAAEREVTLEVESVPVLLEADRANVRQAIANLVRNAMAVAPPSSAVLLRVGTAGDWYGVSVTDAGPGIDPAEHARVFERNWSKSVGGKEGGSGLGLAIARQIAAAHGGIVTVDSTPGEGATFVLWLPAATGADVGVISVDGIHPVDQ